MLHPGHQNSYNLVSFGGLQTIYDRASLIVEFHLQNGLVTVYGKAVDPETMPARRVGEGKHIGDPLFCLLSHGDDLSPRWSKDAHAHQFGYKHMVVARPMHVCTRTRMGIMRLARLGNTLRCRVEQGRSATVLWCGFHVQRKSCRTASHQAGRGHTNTRVAGGAEVDSRA